MRYFVTAIGTDSGKTLVSALLCKALGADYWKPIQAGRPTDSEQIRAWLKTTHIFPEAYLFERACSPHAAAQAEGIDVSLCSICPPSSTRPLVIEGAGGLLVPINESYFIIDLLKKLEAEVVLVVNTYLGCINHALLSAHLLKDKQIPLKGLVFNGPRMPESESAIEKHTGYSCILRIPSLKQVNTAIIEHYALELKEAWPPSLS